MLYLIGLGLWNEQDLSLKAFDAAKSCDDVYMETYTANWTGNTNKIEELIGKKIIVLSRQEVESDFLVEEAKSRNIALLIPGDPLTATTHFQLFYECRKAGISCIVIHSSSVYTAVALTGLQIYKFGRATTLAKPQPGYNPESPYEIIAENKKAGLHSLVLLDTSGDGMTIKEGLQLLQSIDEKRKQGLLKDKIIVAAKLGSEKPLIKYDYASELVIDEKPAVIIIPGLLNFKEEEALEMWS